MQKSACIAAISAKVIGVTFYVHLVQCTFYAAESNKNQNFLRCHIHIKRALHIKPKTNKHSHAFITSTLTSIHRATCIHKSTDNIAAKTNVARVHTQQQGQTWRFTPVTFMHTLYTIVAETRLNQ